MHWFKVFKGSIILNKKKLMSKEESVIDAIAELVKSLFRLGDDDD